MGFELRCFQFLSLPDLATQQCSGRNSWYTRGRFLRVLSYYEELPSRLDACGR